MNTSNPLHESKPLTGLCILLVDDCPDQQRLYSALLRQGGADVILECNGLAAVDNVAKHPNRYDLILTDLDMPLMSGIEVSRELRERGTQIPILAMSARGSVALEREWWQAGCDAYLKKPFTRDVLIKTVMKLIHERPRTKWAEPFVASHRMANPDRLASAACSILELANFNSPRNSSTVPMASSKQANTRNPDNSVALSNDNQPAPAAVYEPSNAIDRAIQRLSQPPFVNRG